MVTNRFYMMLHAWTMKKKILNAQKLPKDRTFLLFLIYGFVWLLQELIVGMMPTY